MANVPPTREPSISAAETLPRVLRVLEGIRLRAESEPVKVAVIGSQKVGPDAVLFLERLGESLVRSGLYLATGNARGADQASARGGNRVDPHRVLLYLPYPRFHRDAIVAGNRVRTPPYSEEFRTLALSLHPAPHALNDFHIEAHTRNVAILEKAAACFAWPRNGVRLGGTGMGMAVAEHVGVPLLDLRDPTVRGVIAGFFRFEDPSAPPPSLFGPHHL